MNDVAVTCLARTVADLSRVQPFEQAVPAGDRALALGLSDADVQRTVAGMGRWPGAPKARRVVEFIDGDSAY